MLAMPLTHHQQKKELLYRKVRRRSLPHTEAIISTFKISGLHVLYSKKMAAVNALIGRLAIVKYMRLYAPVINHRTDVLI